jgi:hypothetical protein
MVTLVYGSLDEPRVILSQWRSEALLYLKILPYSARVERIGPPEAPSFWIPAAHALGYRRLGGGGAEEPFRLSAPALVWIRGELTYRLEGGSRAGGRSRSRARCARQPGAGRRPGSAP